MHISEATNSLLKTLLGLSKGKLARPDDLGLLIELAGRHSKNAVLEELSFHAKFISKTYTIMQRIGMNGEGYEKLADEFGDALNKCTSLINAILGECLPEERRRFASTYLTMTPDSLHHLLALCYDLSWYKNWMIDRQQEEKRRGSSS